MQWEAFYNNNDSSYDFETTRYQIHDGLDCTGYVGWVLYQLFGDKYSDTGYVFASSLSDPDGYRNMSAEEVLADLFADR